MFQAGSGFVPDEIVDGAPVLVCGQNPGESEEREGRPFIGKTGREMESVYFPLAGLVRGVNVSISNTVRCRWRNSDNLPTGKTLTAAIEHCRVHTRIPPSTKLIVAQGGPAATALGCPGSITDWRGFTWEHEGITVLGTLHLAALWRDPKMTRPTRADWAKVPLILNGTFPKPVPPRTWNRRQWFAEARMAPYVAVDTEFGRDDKKLWLIGMGFPGGAGHQIVWTSADETERGAFTALFLDLIATTTIVFQNAVADLPVLEDALGVRYADYRQIEDTMLAHAVLWSEWPHDLEFLASIYGQYPKLKHLNKTDPLLYNWGDCLATIDVWEGLTRELAADPATERIYRTQSLRLIPLILDAHRRGLRVHRDRVAPAAEEYERQRVAATQLAWASAGYPINLGSPKQLADYCYAREGYPVQRDKHTKKPTTDDDAIAVLLAKNPDDDILQARVEYAGATQVLSHYIEPLVGKDRIYPQIKIHVQATGRWSITDPPMQQLPANLRDIVIPDPDEVWFKWDHDQIEYRLLANLANDLPALEAFARGDDIHNLNTEAIFGQPPTDKEDIRRTFTKRFTYRLHYRGDPRQAGDIPGAKQLGLDGPRLVIASRRYLVAHPAIPIFWRTQDEEIRTKGETRTFLGRKRRTVAPKITPAVLRELGNHPLQGGVRDIMNLNLLAIRDAVPWVRFCFEMHDSLYLGCPREKAAETQPIIEGIINREWDVNGRRVRFPAKVSVIG